MANKAETSHQKKLKQLVERRHPEYHDKLPHWEFLESSYESGRGWFSENIFRYIKEGDTEYKDRVGRAYRFNHTREVVDLVDKHLFKQQIARSEDAPESVKNFWKHATANKLGIKEFMRRVSTKSSIVGRVWIVVDNTHSNGIVSVADARASGARTYAYVVMPKAVLDMSYDEEGALNWILIHEQARDDEDPLESDGQMLDRYRLWTRDTWTLYRVVRDGQKVTIDQDGPHEHGLGVVPVFAADNVISDEPYTAPALIDDIAYLDRAVANYLSNLDAIIQDQTFSQLAMPAQGLTPGEDPHKQLLEMGTKRIFTYDGEAGTPVFLSPDVKQAELIVLVVNKIISEIYHTVGLAGERTKDDNSQGIDNSSGVAKAYDFERVNSLLASKADSLEAIENKLVHLVALWNGEGAQIEDKRLVSYPENFDVRGLHDEFDIAARLQLIEAPDTVRRQQMEAVIDKLFPQLQSELRNKMLAELKNWPPEIDPLGDGQSNPIKKEGSNSLANKLVK